jgi:hypothetical protein
MIFLSDQVDAHWDTWGYYHQGTYYLFYLYSGAKTWEGFGVAESRDGVHWTDHGAVLHASDEMVEYLGTGSVWKATDYETSKRFISNYSEWRIDNETGRPVQVILFAWSTDLLHWMKYGDDYIFHADQRYYEKFGRWDCIYTVPRAEGGYWGTWTATPAGRDNLNSGIGFGYSEDGLHWQALEPAQVLPSADEAGAFKVIDGVVYAMFGKWDTGMVCYTAKTITGPYERAVMNSVLLGGGMKHTYFARFFPTPDGLLVNHHTMAGAERPNGRQVTYAAPLKRAVVEDNVLRWRYWDGNEAMRGSAVPSIADRVSDAITFFTPPLDAGTGLICEGVMYMAGSPIQQGLCVQIDERTFVIGASTSRIVIEELHRDTNQIEVLQSAERGIAFGATATYRLLVKRGMLELYLDDYFIECCTLRCYDAVNLRFGVYGKLSEVIYGQTSVWQMNPT